MTLVRHHGGIVIVFTFVVALLLTIIPLPQWARLYRPDWVGLVLIYWCLAVPDRVGVAYGWMLGLLVDALTGSLLGQNALGLTIVAFLTLKLHKRLRLFPIWQQSLTVLLLLVIHQLLSLWISRVIGRPPQPWVYWAPSLVGMLLWPLVFMTLRGLRRQFRVI
jgi:rod shape-determining protein MreD